MITTPPQTMPTHFLHVPIHESLWRAIRERRNATGESTAEIVESALRGQLDLEGDAAFQTSTIGAVLDGVYHGDITVGELREHGDFGLGTFDELDGELVMLDGVVYRMDPQCRAHVVSDEVRSPFATVTRWVTKHSTDLEGLHDMEQFEKRALEVMPSPNYLYGIRGQGLFRRIEVRSVVRQTRRTRLVEATRGQSTRVLENCHGTLVGFFTPAFLGHVGVPGFHLHFITGALDAGGHVLGFDLERGRVELDEMPQLNLALPDSDDFRHAKLAVEAAELEEAERKR
jgi:acetolactate decarboxylase